MLSGDFETGHGEVRTLDLKERYIQSAPQGLHPIDRPLRIVIDAGNGTGGIVAGALYR